MRRGHLCCHPAGGVIATIQSSLYLMLFVCLYKNLFVYFSGFVPSYLLNTLPLLFRYVWLQAFFQASAEMPSEAYIVMLP